VRQGLSVLRYVQNKNAKRLLCGYNNELEKIVSEKGRIWVVHNIVLLMTWLGFQVIKNVRLSVRE